MAAIATPRYEVIVRIANFDDYDRIIGWHCRRVAVTQTAGWAIVLRDRQDMDYDMDAEVREIATGKTVYRAVPVAVDYDAFDEIPF